MFTMHTPPIANKIRFAEMKLVQETVQDFVGTTDKNLSLFNKRMSSKDIEGYLKPSTRLYWIEKIHQLLRFDSFEHTLRNEEAIKIGVVGEYCITIMYLDNHFQDKKYGVKDEKSKKKNRLERIKTKEALDRYIVTEFKGFVQEAITQTVNKLFSLFRVGMKLDQDALTYRNFIYNNPNNLHLINSEVDQYVGVDYFLKILQSYKVHKFAFNLPENYLRLLLTRAFLINTVFFQIFTELLIKLYGKNGADYGNLIEFSRVYGMTQQLVNDNCDYLPVSFGYSTMCKLPEDTFSDMRKGLVTLPIMVFFSQNKFRESGDLFDLYTSTTPPVSPNENDEQLWFLNILKESRSLGYSMSLICSLAHKGESLMQDPVFQNMFSFARGNRYYHEYTLFSF